MVSARAGALGAQSRQETAKGSPAKAVDAGRRWTDRCRRQRSDITPETTMVLSRSATRRKSRLLPVLSAPNPTPSVSNKYTRPLRVTLRVRGGRSHRRSRRQYGLLGELTSARAPCERSPRAGALLPLAKACSAVDCAREGDARTWPPRPI